MSKRYVVLGLSAVLALAIAVPAIGQSSDPTATTSASAKKIAKQAKKKAKKAIKIAKQARETANQALAETDDLDVRVTNIEQAGGAGGPIGPQGPAGPAGATGPAGPAGPGQAFSFALDGDTETVSGDGFSLRFQANNAGVCGSVRIREEAGEDGGFWWADDNSTNPFVPLDATEDENLAGADDVMNTVVAMHLDTSGSAVFEYVHKSSVGGDCIVAGSVIG